MRLLSIAACLVLSVLAGPANASILYLPANGSVTFTGDIPENGLGPLTFYAYLNATPGPLGDYFGASVYASILVWNEDNHTGDTVTENMCWGYGCIASQQRRSSGTVYITDEFRTIHIETRFSSFNVSSMSYPIYIDLPEGIAAVPEPSTWAMMLIGFAGVGFMTWRQRLRGVVAEAGANARNIESLIRIPVAANGLQRL